MKFRCERDSLVEVLAPAGRAVGTRSSAQMVLSGLRIESVGNHLSVIGTDLDLTRRTQDRACAALRAPVTNTGGLAAAHG